MLDATKMRHSNKQELQNCIELVEWAETHPDFEFVFNPNFPWQVVFTMGGKKFSAYPHLKRVVDHTNYTSYDFLKWEEVEELLDGPAK